MSIPLFSLSLRLQCTSWIAPVFLMHSPASLHLLRVFTALFIWGIQVVSRDVSVLYSINLLKVAHYPSSEDTDSSFHFNSYSSLKSDGTFSLLTSLLRIYFDSKALDRSAFPYLNAIDPSRLLLHLILSSTLQDDWEDYISVGFFTWL